MAAASLFVMTAHLYMTHPDDLLCVHDGGKDSSKLRHCCVSSSSTFIQYYYTHYACCGCLKRTMGKSQLNYIRAKAAGSLSRSAVSGALNSFFQGVGSSILIQTLILALTVVDQLPWNTRSSSIDVHYVVTAQFKFAHQRPSAKRSNSSSRT